jgi:hypothetical protein
VHSIADWLQTAHNLSRMKRIDTKSLVAGVLIGGLAVCVMAAGTGAPAQYEYNVVSGLVHNGELKNNLNRAAAEGWDLVHTDTFGQQGAFAVLRKERR